MQLPERIIAGGLVALALAACSALPPAADSPAHRCEDPRPQICTLEYAPVCAGVLQRLFCLCRPGSIGIQRRGLRPRGRVVAGMQHACPIPCSGLECAASLGSKC